MKAGIEWHTPDTSVRSADPWNRDANLYVYAGNDPINGFDAHGLFLETLWDIGSAIVGIIETGANLYAGDYKAAGVSAVGTAVDVAAAVIPFVPGGASIAIKAASKADDAIDVVRGADKVADVGKQADNVIVHRGVDEASPAYADATKGIAEPRGGPKGHTDANAHSAGQTADSNLTSWTTDKKVAKDFATNDSGKGVIMTKEVPQSSLTKPTEPFDPSESEVLIKGTVEGASVERVH